MIIFYFLNSRINIFLCKVFRKNVSGFFSQSYQISEFLVNLFTSEENPFNSFDHLRAGCQVSTIFVYIPSLKFSKELFRNFNPNFSLTLYSEIKL